MRSKALSAVVLAVVGAPFVLAQITYEELYREPSPGYNFAFARVQFNSYRARRRPGWAHDYPRAERNLLRILREVTGVYTSSEKHTAVRLDSPDIMRYPVLYFSEPGSWTITPEEAKNFRSYLLRGGFAIIDDFDGPWDCQTLESCMAQVLPGRHFELLTVDEPIFQSFFTYRTSTRRLPWTSRGRRRSTAFVTTRGGSR